MLSRSRHKIKGNEFFIFYEFKGPAARTAAGNECLVSIILIVPLKAARPKRQKIPLRNILLNVS